MSASTRSGFACWLSLPCPETIDARSRVSQYRGGQAEAHGRDEKRVFASTACRIRFERGVQTFRSSRTGDGRAAAISRGRRAQAWTLLMTTEMTSRASRLCGVCLLVIAALSPRTGQPVPRLANAAAAGGITDTAPAIQDPAELVREVSRKFLDDLSAHRDRHRKDPARLRSVVVRDVLPFFDMQRAARLVLGRHWREATPDQRRRFIAAFEDSMLANYGNALIDFRSSRLRVLPSRVEPGAKFAEVRTEVTRDDGSTVRVNYAMHRTTSGWHAWDVVIDGISYVKSFRTDLGEEIEQVGIDGTIGRFLQSRADGAHR